MSTQFICLSALALKYGTLDYWKRVVERSIPNEWRGAKRSRGTLAYRFALRPRLLAYHPETGIRAVYRLRQVDFTGSYA